MTTPNQTSTSLPSSPSTSRNPLPSILTSSNQPRSRSSSGGDTPIGSRRLRFTSLSELEITSPDDGSSSSSTPGAWHPSKSDPGTPNISEQAEQIRRTLSLASLDTLLTLTQDEMEREKFLSGVKKTGKGLIWRDEREMRKMPSDAERALVLACRRGLRSFVLAYTVRAGINLLLMLMRTFRRRRLKWAIIRHALFGAEPFRFGGMIGTFTFLNTLTLHLLRLAPPFSYLRRRFLRLLHWEYTPLTYGPPKRIAERDLEDGYVYSEEDTGERRWQAAVAGAVGSLGLLWEGKSRRTGVAQQMFVRGLQATYNQVSARTGYKVPLGSIIVFGLSCGQIMFSFLLSPESIPPEYNAWIQSASRVQASAVKTNRAIVRRNAVDVEAVKSALKHKHITARNAKRLRDVLEKAKSGIAPPGVPCAMVHPWLDSCRYVLFERYFTVFRFMLPVYAALHFIPMIVLRRKHVLKDPAGMLVKALLGTARSCSFLSVFVMIYQALLCARTQTLEGYFGKLPALLRQLISRKETFWLIGFSTCLSLFVEESRRRAELAMYVLPKALEAVWSSARKKAWVPLIPFGETILGAVSMAMLMDAYKHDPTAMSGLLRRLIYQIIGPA